MKVNWDDDIPNIWENSKNGNQTTNQEWDNPYEFAHMICFQREFQTQKLHSTFQSPKKSLTGSRMADSVARATR